MTQIKKAWILLVVAAVFGFAAAAMASEAQPEAKQKIFLPGPDGKRIIVTGTSNELWKAADALIQKGEYERARDFYQQMLQNNPKEVRTRVLLGQLYQYQFKKFADAIRQYKTAESLVPVSNPGGRAFCQRLAAEAYRELAEKTNSLIYFVQAITEYEKVAGFDPDDVEVLYYLGSCRLNSNDYQRASELFKEVIEKKPDSEWAALAKKALAASHKDHKG